MEMIYVYIYSLSIELNLPYESLLYLFEKELKDKAIRDLSMAHNKGVGAGGMNTNLYGKRFEEKTDNMPILYQNGYIKHMLTKTRYYLSKNMEDKSITYVSQHGLKIYMKNKYKIDIFRMPDEAYIIEYNTGKKYIKILEKKEQHVEGSVESKLWSSPSFKREYELMVGDGFEVHYCLCVNDFLKTKLTSTQIKYTTLNKIFKENNINVLFGDDVNYFEKLDSWILNDNN